MAPHTSIQSIQSGIDPANTTIKALYSLLDGLYNVLCFLIPMYSRVSWLLELPQ